MSNETNQEQIDALKETLDALPSEQKGADDLDSIRKSFALHEGILEQKSEKAASNGLRELAAYYLGQAYALGRCAVSLKNVA